MPSTRPLATTTDPVQLRRAFGCFPSGVAAVCAEVDGAPVGMVVSSFTSVSLDPPLVSICVDRNSRTWPRLQTADRLGVSILADEHGVACRQLSARGGDRFAGLVLERSRDRAVFLGGATAWLECSIHTELAAGDHQIVLLRVEALDAEPSTGPLVFHGSRFHRLVAQCETPTSGLVL